MSNIEFLSGDIWERISELAKGSKRRHVAVAYVASAGMEMLRLAKGDVLIVDMSEARVKGGATDPALIRQYIDEGVAVYFLQGLHAKGFVFDNTTVAGSTNVSNYSRGHLTEAAILTTDPIDCDYLAKCQKLYKKPAWEPGAGSPSRESMRDWALAVIKKNNSAGFLSTTSWAF